MENSDSLISDSEPTRAYVLIDTRPGMAGIIVQKLRDTGIAMVDAINGPHDAIALVQGDSPSDVAVTILNGIRKMEGVTGVTVYLVTAQEIAAGQ